MRALAFEPTNHNLGLVCAIWLGWMLACWLVHFVARDTPEQ